MIISISTCRKPVLLLSLMFSVLVFSGCSTDPYIHDFVYEGDTARVASMLDDGWPADRANDFGKTGLMIAAEQDDLAMAKLFIREGASVNAKTSGGWTPIYYAARNNGGAEMLALLIDSGAVVDVAINNDWTPLLAAARYRSAAVVETLLDGGANINQTNKAGWTPLLLSVHADNAEVAKLLIHRGADFSRRNNDGKDVFAVSNGKQNTTAAFLTAERERYQAELSERMAFEEEQRFNDRLQAALERDKSLPPEIRRDKYLVAFSSALKNEQFGDALVYAQLLEDNSASVDDSLYYFWGEAFYQEGQPEKAIEKLNMYLAKAGASGNYYTQALQMLLEAEAAL